MQLSYNGYPFPPNGVTISISRTALLTEAKVRYGYTERWTCRGLLEATGQQGISQQIALLETAMSFDFGNVIFTHDDGSLAAQGAISRGTFSGVRVAGPVSYPEGTGAEYSTYRTFEVAFEWDVIYGKVGIISWYETVSPKSAGGPKIEMFTSLNALPQKQTLALFLPYEVTQSGSSVGNTSYPIPPQPNWPQALKKNPLISYRSPKRRGNNFIEWQVDWNYEFVSALPLFGLPNAQPNL
jgi:hypothetical protein